MYGTNPMYALYVLYDHFCVPQEEFFNFSDDIGSLYAPDARLDMFASAIHHSAGGM